MRVNEYRYRYCSGDQWPVARFCSRARIIKVDPEVDTRRTRELFDGIVDWSVVVFTIKILYPHNINIFVESLAKLGESWIKCSHER